VAQVEELGCSAEDIKRFRFRGMGTSPAAGLSPPPSPAAGWNNCRGAIDDLIRAAAQKPPPAFEGDGKISVASKYPAMKAAARTHSCGAAAREQEHTALRIK
jgi:hypothetical protein